MKDSKPILFAGKEPRRILVCQLRQIGDVLLATPSMQLLRTRFPQAELHVLTEKKCVAVLEGNPDVSRIWPIDKNAFQHFGEELAFYWRVARQEFDLVVDFQQLPRCRWVVGMSAARWRVSYPPPWYNRLLYTHWSEPLRGYAAMAKASIMRPLGIEWDGQRPRLFLSNAEQEQAAKLLAELGLRPEERLVSLDATHRRAPRRWPAAHFGRLLRLVLEQEPDLRFLLLYGPGEEEQIQEARASALEQGVPEERLLLPPMLSLRQAAACIARAAVHLGNCSAPRHFAVAVDTPSFVILGATSWGWTFPGSEHRHMALGMECQPCNKNNCADLSCLTRLLPETVLPEFLGHLRRFGTRRPFDG